MMLPKLHGTMTRTTSNLCLSLSLLSLLQYYTVSSLVLGAALVHLDLQQKSWILTMLPRPVRLMASEKQQMIQPPNDELCARPLQSPVHLVTRMMQGMIQMVLLTLKLKAMWRPRMQ
ncbi:hypothetical protein EV702DRAFT_1270879 [Suillus placidus]|uniref:Uncharacterized protein n=1 Tax=Suillus placidus TaxID=48579 RepID=A0A9P6ZM78_9AGAM|nr:hypothetical protein EV702DRAFT_1270879 [Suillus placidus]